MGNSTTFLVLLAIVNVIMWISVLSIHSLNPDRPLDNLCYSSEGTLLDDYITGNSENDTLKTNTADDLPASTQGAVQAESSGGFVTDLFNNIQSFFKGIGKGLNYAMAIINAPSNILGCMGMPQQISNAIGALWNIISLFVFISFMWWRD